MHTAQLLARRFGQEVVSSCAPSEIREDQHEMALALESARAILTDYHEEPTLVTETGEGFLVSSDAHVIFMGGDGRVGVQAIEPAAEHVGHDQEELNRWFSVHEFPDHETHVLAKQLVYDILQSRSGGATDGVWMDELYARTGAGKYASLRKYLVPSVTDFATRGPEDRARHPGAAAAPSTVPAAEGTDEDMPRELSLDDFFNVDEFPDAATATRAAQALEKARESTDTATENAMAKKLYAVMPPDLRKYMHDDFRRMLQAEGVLPPTFTRVVWETDHEDHPTIHVLENDRHRLLLTPVGSDLHGFTEDDLEWVTTGEAAREVYGLPDDVAYVHVQDDAAQAASQALTEMGYTPTGHRRLDEAASQALVLSLAEGGVPTADLLRRLVGETTSPEAVLHEQAGLASLIEAGWLAADGAQPRNAVLTPTAQGAAWLADPAVRVLLPTHEAFAPAADTFARDLLRDIRAHSGQDEAKSRALFQRVVEALTAHGRALGYVGESRAPLTADTVVKALHLEAGTLRNTTSETVTLTLEPGAYITFHPGQPVEAEGPAAIQAMEETITGLFRLTPPTDAMRPFMAAFDTAKQAGDVERAWGAFEALRTYAYDTVTEKDTTKIQATHPGISELPPGAWGSWKVDRLVKHFEALGAKIGAAPAMRAALNIERWNKDKDPALSQKARAVINRIKEQADDDEENGNGEIDRAAVKKAAMKAARSIHGADANAATVDSMIDNAIEKQGAEDTEDAIQIVVGMLRGGGEESAKPAGSPSVTETAEAADPMGEEVFREAADGIVEYKRLTRGERVARLRIRRKPKTAEQRKILKARRIMRKRQKAQFQRAERKYRKKVRRFVTLRKPLTTSAPPSWQPEIAEIEMDVFTVPTAEATHYIDLCVEAGWNPTVETRQEAVDLHAPGEVFDAVDDFLFSETLDGEDEPESPTPQTEAAEAPPAPAAPTADPALAGALLALEGVLPAESPAWGEAKTLLTFLCGNGMVQEAQALLAAIPRGTLAGFEADLTAGATQTGPFVFGDVTPHKAGVALANLHARLSGQTEGLRTSHVATVLDTGRGYKVSEAAFTQAVAGLTPTTEERGANLTFHTYAGPAGVVAQKIEMTGRPPVYLCTTLPEGAAEAWENLLTGKAKALPQPKPPVDVGAADAPKNVAETVVLVVPQARLTDFLEAATQAGAPADADVRAEGAQVFVTLPVPIAHRVRTLFADATVAEPATAGA